MSDAKPQLETQFAAPDLSRHERRAVLFGFVALAVFGLSGWAAFGQSVYLDQLFAGLAGCF